MPFDNRQQPTDFHEGYNPGKLRRSTTRYPAALSLVSITCLYTRL